MAALKRAASSTKAAEPKQKKRKTAAAAPTKASCPTAMPNHNHNHTTMSSQAHHTFDDLVRHGPPVGALEFPEPKIADAVRETVQACNDNDSSPELCHNILRRVGDSTDVAYWPQKRLQTAIYGSVWHCVVLRKRVAATDKHKKMAPTTRRSKKRPTPVAVGAGLLSQKYNTTTAKPNKPKKEAAVWHICANESVAVKQLDLKRIQQMGHRLAEDPIKEVAALQLLEPHPNVVSSVDVLQDDTYLYSITPFCRDGDLFDVVQRHMDEQGPDSTVGLPEDLARTYFVQLLRGLEHLQNQGLCHRDLSLENVMVHEGQAKIIDWGMCLRVPYLNDTLDGVVDVSMTTHKRRLRVTPQGTCGKWKYMSPEVCRNRHPIDGFAVDLWSAAVILFAMLTGYPPYEQPTNADCMYRHLVTLRQLRRVLVESWKVPLSEQVMDLMQKMLHEDPRDRLTLAQIWQHPWIVAANKKEDDDLAEAEATTTKMEVDRSGAALSDDSML